jgi:hypothetical protein
MSRPRSTRPRISSHMLLPKAPTQTLSAITTSAAVTRIRQSFRISRFSRHIARRSAKVMDPAYCRRITGTTAAVAAARGQRSLAVTANTYSHVLVAEDELDDQELLG